MSSRIFLLLLVLFSATTGIAVASDEGGKESVQSSDGQTGDDGCA